MRGPQDGESDMEMGKALAFGNQVMQPSHACTWMTAGCVVCVLACLHSGARAVPCVDVVGIVMELALGLLLAPDEALDLDPITDAVCLDAVKERQLLRPETHTCTSTHTQKP